MTEENLQSPLLIDTNADPFCPEGWEVIEHKSMGVIEWQPALSSVWVVDGQQGGAITGHRLYEKLAGMKVLNANALDTFLRPENVHKISEHWKKKYIFFWGTVYRDPTRQACVRFLYNDLGPWRWGYRWLTIHWNSSEPALLWR